MDYIFWRQRDAASIDILVVRWYNSNRIGTRKKTTIQYMRKSIHKWTQYNLWKTAFKLEGGMVHS